MKGLIGKKLGMTQVYDEKGVLIPVTVIEVGPCVVTAVKTVERDGYSAIQLGYGSRKAKNVTKACQGHLAKAGVTGAALPAVLREIRTAETVEAGTVLKADIFAAGEYLDVTGTTKGRGFQGCVKRWNFGGGRASHGGDWERRPVEPVLSDSANSPVVLPRVKRCPDIMAMTAAPSRISRSSALWPRKMLSSSKVPSPVPTAVC